MSKHLLIGETASNWRLPAETDLAALHESIRQAMIDGAVLEIEVEMGDDPLHRSKLLMNGSALGNAIVVEIAEPS